jgi:tetratricopeptide (TPR) repeat protein
VPFKVSAGKTLIVLAGAGRPGSATMPREVTIPVGFPAAGFFFVHSCAYSANNLIAVYQVQYADGSTYDIPLRLEENIRDWAVTPAPFLREKETQSIVAWQGSCPMFKTIGVYRMLWVNPRPDVPVKAIRFSNPTGEVVPILMGLTAAVHGGRTAGATADAAGAQALLARAKEALAAQRLDEAAGLLKQAVAADPTLSAAHQALADLCERRGDEDGALAAYRAWAATQPSTPLPYNRIGEILEKRNDLKGALEAYTQSLKVEWNQPPAIQAKSRLEKAVNP